MLATMGASEERLAEEDSKMARYSWTNNARFSLLAVYSRVREEAAVYDVRKIAEIILSFSSNKKRHLKAFEEYQ